MPAVPDASSAPRSASAEAASRASVAVRWAVGVGAATMTAIGLVLLFLLTLATNNRALYERNYAWLFGVNVLVAALLLGVLKRVLTEAHGQLLEVGRVQLELFGPGCLVDALPR